MNNPIPTTRLRLVKSTNICSVGLKRQAWRHTMTMCWKQKTTLCDSQATDTGIASRSLWQACQMIRLLGSWNFTLSRIWDGLTINNALSNTGVKISSKVWDSWCSTQPTLSISFMPLSVALTVMSHRNNSILICTLWTGGGRHRSGEKLHDNNMLIHISSTLRVGYTVVSLICISDGTHL